MRSSTLLLLLLSACVYVTSDDDAARWDLDGDGVPRPLDCDDDDPEVQGPVDWFLDADGDAHGDPDAPVSACEPPARHVALGDDCDDDAPLIYPGRAELCDGIDQDCDGTLDEGLPLSVFFRDGDGDGFGDPEEAVQACATPAGAADNPLDCDDGEIFVFPGAVEICNGIDDDCDGDTDADDPGVFGASWYLDLDGDGYGAGAAVLSCTEPEFGTRVDGDCDDLDPTVHPLALELCDGVDQDCTGDEVGAVDAVDWHPDLDGDGYGDADAAHLVSCEAPIGFVTDDRDCDDTRAAVHPAAIEVCNGLDDDCDGQIDDADATVVAPERYRDADGDGFGDPAVRVRACVVPPGYAPAPGDCDDTAGARFPGAVEVCGGGDEDCDGRVDEADPDLDLTDAPLWYVDADRDGFGDPGEDPVRSCVRPVGRVGNADDCGDFDRLLSPAVPELCDGFDNDCNGLVDDDTRDVLWHQDLDQDGYGAGPTLMSCERSDGFAVFAGDCDEGAPTIHPGADELCNLADDDCDGLVDDADADVLAPAWFLDDDGDTHGDSQVQLFACRAPPGHVALSDDCDDADPDVNPLAPELCFGTDEDCDGLVDDGDPDVADPLAWSPDLDRDGFGGEALVVRQCEAPLGWRGSGLDCDDTDPDVSPIAVEVCSGVDEDCDGLIDDADPSVDPAGRSLLLPDVDGDGFGDGVAVASCSGAEVGGDCAPDDPAVHPGAPEICDGVDNDCSGSIDDNLVTLWYRDADGDGWGDDQRVDATCDPGPGWVVRGGDCDDDLASRNPDATERCTGGDDDCDGLVDEADPDVVPSSWWLDGDGDGWGAGTPVGSCAPVAGRVDRGGDCNDQRIDVHPGAWETCELGDEDCDGIEGTWDPDLVDGLGWYRDTDLDGFGDVGTLRLACESPAGHVPDGTDCDDGDRRVSPGAVELCNAIDDDCDGWADDADPEGPTDPTPWYVDVDGDLWGTTSLVTFACDRPPGFRARAGDCDDGSPAVSPAAIEVCNGVDDNCDGLVDGTCSQPDTAGDTATASLDGDGDGHPDARDNCPLDRNPNQKDGDGDGVGDACDRCPGADDRGPDGDFDGVPDCADVCAGVPDGHDDDDDGVPACLDVCPEVKDVPQRDIDGDGVGDRCDVCVRTPDDQTDTDGDGIGDACEAGAGDGDGDGLPDAQEAAHGGDPTRPDTDGDGLLDGFEVYLGTAVDDPDTDGDGVSDYDEVLVLGTDPLVSDLPGDTGDTGTGAAADLDGDGVTDALDVCPAAFDLPQLDFDGDGVGDRCDVCPGDPDPDQADTDGDGRGDACGPSAGDADGDAVPDVLEFLTDPDDPDTDGDGLSDGMEAFVTFTDPTDEDMDGDGLNDGDEVWSWGTDPRDADSDGGGVEDGVEVASGCDPSDPVDDSACGP